MSKILVVDDDKDIRELLVILLQAEGHEVYEAENGEVAIEKAKEDINLIILDVMMPKLNGIQACIEIRKKSHAPILFLTAKGQEGDKVIGLSAGGDDYLVKPFSPGELTARVKALLRRHLVYQNSVDLDENKSIVIRGLEIDTDMCRVLVNKEEKILTPIEYEILILLAKHSKKIFSAQNIYETVWNEPFLANSNNTVMVHISKLREKLEQNPQNPQYIKTVWGMGYKID